MAVMSRNGIFDDLAVAIVVRQGEIRVLPGIATEKLLRLMPSGSKTSARTASSQDFPVIVSTRIARREEHQVVVLPLLPQVGRRLQVGQRADEVSRGWRMCCCTRRGRGAAAPSDGSPGRGASAARRPGRRRAGTRGCNCGPACPTRPCLRRRACPSAKVVKALEDEPMARSVSGVTGSLLFDVPKSEALGEDDLLVLDDGDRRRPEP